MPRASILFLPLVVLISGAEPISSPPKKVTDAQATILTWLNELPGKSEDDVVKLLGQPSKKTTVKILDAQAPVLHYGKEGKSTLMLILHEGRVETASMQLFSK